MHKEKIKDSVDIVEAEDKMTNTPIPEVDKYKGILFIILALFLAITNVVWLGDSFFYVIALTSAAYGVLLVFLNK